MPISSPTSIYPGIKCAWEKKILERGRLFTLIICTIFLLNEFSSSLSSIIYPENSLTPSLKKTHHHDLFSSSRICNIIF